MSATTQSCRRTSHLQPRSSSACRCAAPLRFSSTCWEFVDRDYRQRNRASRPVGDAPLPLFSRSEETAMANPLRNRLLRSVVLILCAFLASASALSGQALSDNADLLLSPSLLAGKTTAP